MCKIGLTLRSQKHHCEELCPPVLHPEETLVLSHLQARFIGSSVRGCMIPSHLSPDSGVIDSDLCERRQKCHGENMCVSLHQFCSAPMEPNHIWNCKKSLTVMLWYLQKSAGLPQIYFFKDTCMHNKPNNSTYTYTLSESIKYKIIK